MIIDLFLHNFSDSIKDSDAKSIIKLSQQVDLALTQSNGAIQVHYIVIIWLRWDLNKLSIVQFYCEQGAKCSRLSVQLVQSSSIEFSSVGDRVWICWGPHLCNTCGTPLLIFKAIKSVLYQNLIIKCKYIATDLSQLSFCL